MVRFSLHSLSCILLPTAALASTQAGDVPLPESVTYIEFKRYSSSDCSPESLVQEGDHFIQDRCTLRQSRNSNGAVTRRHNHRFELTTCGATDMETRFFEDSSCSEGSTEAPVRRVLGCSALPGTSGFARLTCGFRSHNFVRFDAYNDTSCTQLLYAGATFGLNVGACWRGFLFQVVDGRMWQYSYGTPDCSGPVSSNFSYRTWVLRCGYHFQGVSLKGLHHESSLPPSRPGTVSGIGRVVMGKSCVALLMLVVVFLPVQ